MDISNIIPHIEALIFASEKPLTALELTELTNNAFGFMENKINLDQVESAIEGIIEKYAASFYPFEMKESGGGWQFLTKKDYHKTVAQLNGEKFLKRLSAASLETLAIIAYKQPITKGDVESIRGVNSDYSIQKLLEKELIIITGRNEELPGKPLVYATSKSFMDYFGINSADELPKIKEVFPEQGVEATIVKGKASEDEENLLISDPEAPQNEILLVVRGNGELIEEPQIVINEDTEPVAPEILEVPEAEAIPVRLEDQHSQPETEEFEQPEENKVEDVTRPVSSQEDEKDPDHQGSADDADIPSIENGKPDENNQNVKEEQREE